MYERMYESLGGRALREAVAFGEPVVGERQPKIVFALRPVRNVRVRRPVGIPSDIAQRLKADAQRWYHAVQ